MRLTHDVKVIYMSKTLKTTKIKINDKITYDWKHKDYGRAEFTFCPFFKNGYMEKLYIYRKQQGEDEEFIFDIKEDKMKINVFQITAWTHKTEAPRVWRNSWCEKHKCIAFEVYVPPNTNRIVFSYHFGNSLEIRMEEKPDDEE